jgi:Ion transport protein
MTPLSNYFSIFKAIRVLRLINRNEGLQVAVRALIYGIPNILNVTLIMLLFFLIFGVIFVSGFKGKFYYCSDDITNIEINSKWDCLNAGGVWQN